MRSTVVPSARTTQHDEMGETPDHLANDSETFSQVMVVRGAGSPSSHTAEVVPYRPPIIEETFTQQDRRARADAGDLQARLELIPLHAVEDQLSRCFRTSRQDRSILTCLLGGDGAQPAHVAARSVLEELADTTEHAAYTSALVYRYVQAHGLWKADPSVHSAEAFLDTLDNAEHVKANIVMGSSAQVVKWRSIRRIEARWGPDWFRTLLEEVPEEIRDCDWTRPEECSKRTLMQMAQNAERGHSIHASTTHWKAAMSLRTDEEARKRHGITGSRARWIILDDVRSLNRLENGDLDTSLQSQLQDRLRVELVPIAAQDRDPVQPLRKRKRTEITRPVDVGDGWRMAADGQAMIKRVRDQLIRRPVVSAVDSPSPLAITPTETSRVDITITDVDGSTQRHASSPLPSPTPPASPTVDETPPDSPSPRSCTGPAVAVQFDKVAQLCGDIRSGDPDTTRVVKDCCDSCRDHVLRLLASLKADVLPSIEALRQTRTHTFPAS